VAAVKWIFVVLFGLGSAGALGMAFVDGGVSRPVSPRTSPPISLRQFPVMVASVGTPKAPDVAKAPEPAAKPPEPEVAAKPPEPEAAKPAEPVKPEPVAAKPPEPAAKPPEPAAKPPEPAAKPPAPVAKAPEVAKPPEPKAEPKAEPAAKPPEPVAVKAPPPEGLLNLRATDTADVYLDGKKLGGSPLLGIKAKVGNHKVRFDCYDAAGNTVAGPVQVIAVKAEGEVDVEYPCPVE